MPQTTIELPRLHSSQQFVIDNSKRFCCLICGRRWGKSSLAIDRTVNAALQGTPVGWFAPNYVHLNDSFRSLTEILRPATTELSRSERRISLRGGGSVSFFSLDSGGEVARGKSFGFITIDEAAVCQYLQSAWELAIRPTLTDLRGGALIASTPKGAGTFLHALYMRGLEPDSEWSSFCQPTASNPFISPQEIESARLELSPLAFGQEYLGLFQNLYGSVFTSLRESIYQVPEHLANYRANDSRAYLSRYSSRFAIGVDWAGSGGGGDYTVFTVVCADGSADLVYDADGSVEPQVFVVHIDRFRGVDYAMQQARLRALWERFGRCQVLVETNSIGSPMLEALIKSSMRVTGFHTTAGTKAQIVETVQLMLQRRILKLPDMPELLAEMSAFEGTRLPSGLTRYAAPPGAKDDLVLSLCLAVHALRLLTYRDDPRHRAVMEKLAGALGAA